MKKIIFTLVLTFSVIMSLFIVKNVNAEESSSSYEYQFNYEVETRKHVNYKNDYGTIFPTSLSYSYVLTCNNYDIIDDLNFEIYICALSTYDYELKQIIYEIEVEYYSYLLAETIDSFYYFDTFSRVIPTDYLYRDYSIDLEITTYNEPDENTLYINFCSAILDLDVMIPYTYDYFNNIGFADIDLSVYYPIGDNNVEQLVNAYEEFKKYYEKCEELEEFSSETENLVFNNYRDAYYDSSVYYANYIDDIVDLKDINTILIDEYNLLYDIWFRENSDYYFDIGYAEGYTKGQENGFANGHEQGRTEGENVGLKFKDLFISILDAPTSIISNVLNFEFLGINLASLVFFLLSSVLVIAIIKFFL